MFNARERPRGRDDKSADVLVDYEFSVHLRKPKIVTNTEAKAQAAQSKTPKRIARNKTPLFVNGRDCIQMGFSIFRSNFSPPIDKDQGIVNSRAVLLRYAAHDGNGKFRGDFLKSGNETAGPRIGVSLDHGHRVTRVGH